MLCLQKNNYIHTYIHNKEVIKKTNLLHTHYIIIIIQQ